jgi:hypothetical protein
MMQDMFEKFIGKITQPVSANGAEMIQLPFFFTYS